MLYEDGKIECWGNWYTTRGCRTTNYDGFDRIRELHLSTVQKITKHVSNRIGIAHFVMFEDEKNFAFLSCFHKRLGKDCGWIKELHIEIVRFFIFENIACSRMLARPNKYIAQQIGISGRDLENWTM